MAPRRVRPLFDELEDRLVPSAVTQFTSVGVGGGGYYGAPSVSPTNPNDFYIATDMGAMYQTTDGGQDWTTLNPFQSQIGGTYYQPVQFTNDPNTLYANNNVPMKSADGGATWAPITDPAGSGNWISQLFSDTNNSNNVVISANNTIFLSTDGGNSFGAVAGPSGSGAPITLNLPADNQQLYVAGLYSAAPNDALYLATNGGLLIGTPTGNSNSPYSWSLSTAGGLPSGTSIWSFAGATQGGTTRLYAILWSDASVNVQDHDFDGMSTYAGTYSLTIGQSSWTALAAVPQGDPGQTDTPAYIATDPSNLNVIYQGGTNSSWGAPLVWKSTNGGQSWTQTIQWSNNGNIQTGILGISNDFPWYWGGSVSGISVSAANVNDVVITTNFGAFSTTDGGAQWTSILQQNPQADGSSAAGMAYVSSNNDTSNWGVNFVNSTTMVAGYSDISAEVSTDGGTSWALSSYDNQPNVVYGSVTDPYNGTVYEAGGYYHDLFQQWNTGDVSGGDGGIYASTNNGQSFTLIHDFGSTATSVALDPSDPTHNTMYVTLVDSDTANPNNPNNPSFYSGLGGVWVTNDLSDGANAKWYQLNQPTVAWGPAAGEAANHHAYTVNVLNNGEILVTFAREDSEVDQAGVFLGKVTWNNGVPTATWTDVTPNDGSSTPDAARTWAMDLTIDPTDPTQQTWYLGSYILDHAEADSSRGLWRTTNGGQTWTLILGQTASDPYGPANPAKLGVFGGYVDPATGELYVGTPGDGLWYSADPTAASPTFQQVTAFPFSNVTRVSFNPYNSSQVWVSTFGDGLWVGTAPGSTSNPPSAPTDLQATAGNGEVSLDWNASSGASGYDIYRSTTSDGEGATPYLTGVTGTSFTDTSVTDGTEYFYEVSAVDDAGQSGMSNEASATPQVPAPAAPTGLTATAGNALVGLSWTASSGATSYDLYRSTSTGQETLYQSGLTSTSYTDTAVTNGTAYYYEVTAVNGGGESSGSNEASATPQQVSLQSATVLTSSASSPVFGQSITLTATVTAASGSATPTGNVLFMDGQTPLGTALLNSSGVATLNVILTTVGTNNLTASYSGDSTFDSSKSATLSEKVKKASSQVALTSSTASLAFGQSVTFTATVGAVSPGSGTPTGSVTFYSGTTVLATATLSNGVATFTTSGLAVGSHTIKASYGGDPDFGTSSKSISQPVKKDTTKLGGSPTTATKNQAVTLTATVSVASPGSGSPTGTVTFKDATTGQSLGTATVVNGTATLSSVTFTTSGKHKITVSYSGDGDDLTSTLSWVITVAI